MRKSVMAQFLEVKRISAFACVFGGMMAMAPVSVAVEAPQLWNEYVTFANGRWDPTELAADPVKREKARKSYFAEHFSGQQVTLTGSFSNSGKAVLGGIYVSLKVDGISVKVMARPNEKDRIGSFAAGDKVTFTATFKSRGDAMHGVTFEDGVFAAGEAKPTAAEEQAAEVTGDSDLWQAYRKFASERYAKTDDPVETEKQRKALFAEKFYGKRAQLSGTFKKSGKALLGGTYVSMTVDDVSVKVMVRPSEKGKLKKLSAGDAIKISGTFKSRGDLMHGVTFEDGVVE